MFTNFSIEVDGVTVKTPDYNNDEGIREMNSLKR